LVAFGRGRYHAGLLHARYKDDAGWPALHLTTAASNIRDDLAHFERISLAAYGRTSRLPDRRSALRLHISACI